MYDLARTLRRTGRGIRRLADRAADRPAGHPREFGLPWCRHFLPRYFPGDPADFHADLFATLRDLHRRRGSREAVIAPREGTKSTVVTLAYVLYASVSGAEPFTLILSDGSDQADDQLGHVRAELEGNEELAAAYPDGCGPGPVWRRDRLTLSNGAVVQALNTSQLRRQ